MTKLALITGATGGLGSTLAHRLWRDGWSLVALGHTERKMAALCDVLYDMQHPPGQNFSGLTLDFSRPCADWWRVRSSLEQYVRQGYALDLVAVCHGVAPQPGPALHAWQALQDVHTIDVLGAFKACEVAGRYMLRQRHGSMVLVSSLHANQTYPQRLPYCVAKSAICGMARALAVEWGPRGVRVNTVLPWQCAGERSQAMIDAARDNGENLEEAYKQKSPMRRLIQPEEVADAILFLAQNAACNGVELVLDGGVSQSMWYKGFTTTP